MRVELRSERDERMDRLTHIILTILIFTFCLVLAVG